ncbi:toll/interleukin-1 receptor domain-containing protein [Acinetobacter sp. ANC 4945]|uniref:TIR domain-containing protein n=1 Tax=Acinetobacter amyesii TaxID=2942470 RepID=A0A1T1GWK2_9GAMM|nr:toll/interleukin-1 receptor domain-containing protein [Acinetobacter amyesii]MCL6247113.1 toll/interleukin-1 receptor domain-containing protein [Acinetobacter amyesii]OOV81986.1 hypothetical protein B1202_11140 [Acinetobacter amyesii]
MTAQLDKIQKLIDNGNSVLKTHKPNAPNVIGFATCNLELFTTWKIQALSFLKNNCGLSSPYYTEFFSKVSTPHMSQINIGLGILKAVLEDFNETLDYSASNQSTNSNIKELKKIFISHATKDKVIIEEIIELLESIGVESEQIFCSSFEGYGIPLGENFLEKIRKELSSDVLVLFVLTENFYESKVCLCEMGAAWALSKQHIPIVVPPLSYSDIQGVIPLTQGLIINDITKLNSFKERIEELFKFKNKLSFSTWERKRERFIRDVETHFSVS